MGYNAAQSKMKRILVFIAGIMIALVFASGCTKVVTQSSVYEFNITFSNAADKQIVTETYTALKDNNLSSYAVLAYIYIGNASGEDVWTPLPTLNGSEYYDYAYTDNGIFAFSADAGDGYVWTNNLTLKYRLILIPKTVLTSKSTKEIENKDYNEVMNEFGLYESTVIKK